MINEQSNISVIGSLGKEVSVYDEDWKCGQRESLSFALKGDRDLAAAAKSLQLCPTLCDPIDGSPPGSPVPGILQARVLEWGAFDFSRQRSLAIAKKQSEIMRNF